MLSSKSVSLYWHNHSNLITQAVKQKVKEITVVNLKYIEKVHSHEITLCNGLIVIIGRARSKEFKKEFLNGECGLIIDFCVVCAGSILFFSNCDINETLRLRQEV